VKLVDFGLAQLLRDANAGATFESPQYMAPEQARAPLAPMDARADVYALGAVLYEMLVGTPLVPAYPTHERMRLHLETLAPSRVSEAITDIAPELDALVAEMVASVETRVASPREVRERLLRVYPDLSASAISLAPPPVVSGMQPIRASARRAGRASLPPISELVPASRANVRHAREDRWLVVIVALLGALVAILGVLAVVRALAP
jgi:serine/threonine protein kinase